MTPPTPNPATALPLLDLPAAPHSRGFGDLSVNVRDRKVSLPLASVDIQARVADCVAEVTMVQVFQNGHAEPLEAVYTFPLPGGAAVKGFELRVGDRVIQGVVRERAEARREYRRALEEGRRAALLEEERDDVFTMQVGNLPPGEKVHLKITWSERLSFFEDGTTEIRLPLVVAPRYIPGAPVERPDVGTGVEGDTDVVPDASRITPPRLAPGFDPAVALRIGVEVMGASAGLADLRCSQHATQMRMESGVLRIELAREGERLDRDFVLRWRLAGESVRPRLLVYAEAEGRRYGVLTLVPPARQGSVGVARDVVFVLDRSGSMSGTKMVSAARACSILLHTLGPRDRFAIQAFDDTVEWLGADRRRGPSFLPADEAGRERGDRYLRGIEARGGTELDGAMSAALALVGGRRDASGRMPVVVLLTDGQVGDEGRLLKRLQKELGDARVFTVGIDTAVNDAFLRRLASLGGGTSTFVTPGQALEEALVEVGREIGVPLVTNLSIEDAGCGLKDKKLAPSRIPDLFQGRASTVFLRCKGPGKVRVRGRGADGNAFDQEVEAEEVDLPALAQLWARARVTDLEDAFRLGQREAKQQIIDLAVKHSLLTRFTAFVVVDEAEIVNPSGQVRTVAQPVEMPAQWEMDAASSVHMCCLASPNSGLDRLDAFLAHGGDVSDYFESGPSPSYAPPAYRRTREGSAPPSPSPSAAEYRARGGARPSPSRNAPKFKKAAVPPPPPPPAAAPSKKEAGGARPTLPPGGGDVDKRKRDEAKSQAALSEARLLREAFEALERALVEARRETEQGGNPAKVLEEARKRVLELVASIDLAARLLLLHRFLNVTLVRVVEYLSRDADVVLLELALEEFEEVRREACVALGGIPEEPFWEGSV